MISSIAGMDVEIGGSQREVNQRFKCLCPPLWPSILDSNAIFSWPYSVRLFAAGVFPGWTPSFGLSNSSPQRLRKRSNADVLDSLTVSVRRSDKTGSPFARISSFARQCSRSDQVKSSLSTQDGVLGPSPTAHLLGSCRYRLHLITIRVRQGDTRRALGLHRLDVLPGKLERCGEAWGKRGLCARPVLL